MGNMYDPTSYGGGAPSGGAQAGVSDAISAARGISDVIKAHPMKRQSKGSPSPDRTPGPDPDPDSYRMAVPGTYKRGGMVRKTGMAKVHAGERILTKAQQKKRKRARGAHR